MKINMKTIFEQKDLYRTSDLACATAISLFVRLNSIDKTYSRRVLDQGQPNWLTRLLWLLVHDKAVEAKQWMAEMPTNADGVERANGFDLISEYERGEFF